MATLNQLTEQTLGEVSGYVKNQESVTIATNTVTSGDVSITVDDASALSKGIVEIDDELIYVKKSVHSSHTRTSATPSCTLRRMIAGSSGI